MITPDDLLEFAFDLVIERRGSEAHARRAISAAYYALFHRIALDGAALFAGSPAQRARIARSYDHGAVASASLDIGRRRTGPGSTPDARLAAVANSFLSLREGRERADYDLESTVTRQDAVELVWEALRAFLLAPLTQKRGRRG